VAVALAPCIGSSRGRCIFERCDEQYVVIQPISPFLWNAAVGKPCDTIMSQRCQIMAAPLVRHGVCVNSFDSHVLCTSARVMTTAVSKHQTKKKKRKPYAVRPKHFGAVMLGSLVGDVRLVAHCFG